MTDKPMWTLVDPDDLAGSADPRFVACGRFLDVAMMLRANGVCHDHIMNGLISVYANLAVQEGTVEGSIKALLLAILTLMRAIDAEAVPFDPDRAG